jgi:hypothetical protein
MSSPKLGLVEYEIMKVIGSDFRVWKSNHPYMEIDQYGGIDFDEAIHRLPWWVKIIIVVNGLLRRKNLQGVK